MGRISKLFLILLTTTFFQLLAQSVNDLIKNELPSAVIMDQTVFDQVNKTIEADIKLNPDLVCLRLQYLNSYFNEGIKESSENGFEYLKTRLLNEYEKRNAWLQKQIEKTLQSEYKIDYKSAVKNIFESLKTEVINTEKISSNKFECDRNRTDYIVAGILSNNKLTGYDASKDYGPDRIEAEKTIILKFEEIYKSLTTDPVYQSTTDVEDILNYWYLFDNNKEQSFDVYEFLLADYRNYYDIIRLPDDNMFIGGTFLFLNENYDVNLTFDELKKEFRLGEIKNSTHLHIQYTHKFRFSETIEALSHLTIGIYAAIALDASEKILDTILYTKTNESGNDYISHLWDLNDISISNILRTAFFIKATVPILAIGRVSSLEAGFLAGVNISSFEFNYSYRYISTMVDYDEIHGGYHNQQLANYTEGPISESKTEVGFIFYPTIELNLYLTDPLILQIGTGYNYFSARIGIGL